MGKLNWWLIMNEKRLFDLREYKDLSQIKLADYLGITQQTYSLWEKGTKIIPLKHLNNLSNFYEISMDYIVGLTDEKNNSGIIKLTELNKNEIGSRIKKIREDNNLTLRDLAKELNTTSSTISAYETGKTLILTAFAYQICIKYNVSLDWLCGKRK
ncbi:transcriptional regulator, XRE family [human gut metagenome]|jgi:transcriptional regulator with XRE-family HTH domain|uniref:Transcriptional regulator, XRE family n=1 Tax=human gut metagenome TaxID=408170 RepID=K1S102_9ZZZZ